MRCISCDTAYETTEDERYELCTKCFRISDKCDYWPSDKRYVLQDAKEGVTPAAGNSD